MAISWIALSPVVVKHLEKFAQSQAEKLVSKQADGVLARAYRKLVPDKRLTLANQTFAARFGKELDSAVDLPTVQAQSYKEALDRFLCNPSVQHALLAPLDGVSDLDWELLRGIWSSIGIAGEEDLIVLPADFDWARVGKRYRESINNQMLADPELRPVIAALAALRSAEANERTASTLSRGARLARPFDLLRYGTIVKACFSHLVLGPLDSDWTQYERRVHLEGVYVPQSVKQALPPSDMMRDYTRRPTKYKPSEQELSADEQQVQRRMAEYSQVASRPLIEVVEDPRHTRIVLLGDPGLGKSTLLKFLALKWANEPDRPVALFMELRRAADHEDLLDYMEAGPLPTCCLPKVELDQHLRRSATLVLFDGLDEVNEGRRGDMVSKIIAFLNDYPKARAIVTTRIHGYHPGSAHPEQFADAGFLQFTLQDFDEPEIDRFIALWHSEAFRIAGERGQYEKRVRKAVEDSPAIRELASNPLLLTMMVILSRTQDLPRDRCKLYEKCSELLLRNWDLEKFPEIKERKDARDLKDKLGPEQKMRILELVASAMQRERAGLEGNMISEEALKEIVGRELTLLGIEPAWIITDDLIWMLRERNFMLGYMGGRRYAFVHRTFLEYFCARDLKFRLERTSDLTVNDLRHFFRTHWQWDVWHEVLRLLCGIIGAEHAGKCVSELLDQSDFPEGHRAVFLAAQCLQEIREVGTIPEIRMQARNMLLPLTDFHFPYFYESWDPEARETIRIRIRAIKELARGWRDQQETLSWLKKRAEDEESWASRYSALRELGRGWRTDSEVLAILRAHAVADDSPPVRQIAIQELARGWSDDAETLPYLKEVALLDEAPLVIRTVIDEVARIWKNAPDTMTWLVERATVGGDPVTQLAAMAALYRHWKNIPLIQQLNADFHWSPPTRIDVYDMDLLWGE